MKDEDLDFTRTLAKPIPAPSLELVESAGKEAAVGGPHLRSAGYYVAMARRAAARMPVILMTGKSEVADVKAGLAAGADGYVSKPFKVSALVTAVNLVLGRT